MTPDLVELDDVSVGFPRRPGPTLRGIDLQIGAGEQVVVLGPSGSGKSTLLHLVAGTVPHSVGADVTGSVRVAGTDTVDTTVVERSRAVGVLAQDPAAALCLPRVDDDVALTLENHATPPGLISTRIDEALDAVGAGQLRERPTGALSGGETQRVALAGSLVARPAVLLLDEPTAMLDPDGVAAVRSAVAAAASAYAPAVLLVEHRLDEFAGDLGTAGLPARAVVLGADGTVLADGPTATVLATHAADLLQSGCWLPLDAELQAVSGYAGGLAEERVLRHLDRLAERPGPVVPTAEQPTGRVLLSTRGLDVGRRSGRSRRRARAAADQPVLTGVTLDLVGGEVVALLGANGSGKSTLLLTLARLLDPLAGDVEGAPVGMVFQNPEHQFLAHTVAGEIGWGLDPARAAEVVPHRLRTHRLEHVATTSPFRVSGGEKRRLSLAALLAHDRPVLLADEPTFGLDRRDAVATAAALREAAPGRAVLFSSHDLRLVATLADRAVVIADGAVVADGRTLEVLADDDVLRRARLRRPPLLDRLLSRYGDPAAVRRVLDALDAAVPHGATARAPDTAGAR